MKSAHWITINSNNYTTISNNTVTVLLWGIEMLSFWEDIFNGKKIANGPKKPSVTSERVPISSKPSNLDCRDSGESFDAHIVAVCKIFEKGRGFCRAPCLAVGLLYTCILQGARQAQGPCCTNPIVNRVWGWNNCFRNSWRFEQGWDIFLRPCILVHNLESTVFYKHMEM